MKHCEVNFKSSSLFVIIIFTFVFVMVPLFASAQEDDNETKRRLDVTDFCDQVAGWEWLYVEDREFKHLDYPTQVSFYSYPTHPQYRIVGNGIYDETGKLIRWGYVIRKDYYYETPSLYTGGSEEQDRALTIMQRMYDGWDENCTFINNFIHRTQELKLIVDDIKNNSLGTNSEPREVIDRVFNLLSWTIYDFDGDRGGEGSGDEPDAGVAERIIKQSKSNHEDDMSFISKIKRVDNLSFDITYTNPKTGKSNTLRLEFYQGSPYYAAYRIKIDGMVWMDLSSKMDRTIDASIRNYGLNTK